MWAILYGKARDTFTEKLNMSDEGALSARAYPFVPFLTRTMPDKTRVRGQRLCTVCGHASTPPPAVAQHTATPRVGRWSTNRVSP